MGGGRGCGLSAEQQRNWKGVQGEEGGCCGIVTAVRGRAGQR